MVDESISAMLDAARSLVSSLETDVASTDGVEFPAQDNESELDQFASVETGDVDVPLEAIFDESVNSEEFVGTEEFINFTFHEEDTFSDDAIAVERSSIADDTTTAMGGVITDSVGAMAGVVIANAPMTSQKNEVVQEDIDSVAAPQGRTFEFSPPHLDLEPAPRRVPAPSSATDELRSARQRLAQQINALQGQIDLLQLREEKLILQRHNYVREIDELNEQNQVLETLIDELPEIYRQKFMVRMQPIQDRIVTIQEENIRLHEEIGWLNQQLEENILPPPAPRSRPVIQLPSFARRVALPSAMAQ